jgi:hypothetical protein
MESLELNAEGEEPHEPLRGDLMPDVRKLNGSAV